MVYARACDCDNTKMADLAEENSTPSTETTMQTVELTSQRSGNRQPVLQFDSGSSEVVAEASMQTETLSPIEGTELQARPRTGSRGTQLKDWSSHQIKLTKQIVSEKFGRGLRTVDPQLDARIENLKETQRKYAQLIAITSQFHTNFFHVVETQKCLAEHFAFMSVRNSELHTEFHYNAEAQKRTAQSGEALLAACRLFHSSMQTMSTKTMEDTLQTVKGYESARLAYDAYRSELEDLKKQANAGQSAAAKLPLATEEFEKHKRKFEQLRHDVDIKLKLLDENKLKVTQKQLILFHKAFAAYFSGNHTVMEALTQELQSKLEETRRRGPPAWLEELPSSQEQQ